MREFGHWVCLMHTVSVDEVVDEDVVVAAAAAAFCSFALTALEFLQLVV